jgi:hypothetical protein
LARYPAVRRASDDPYGNPGAWTTTKRAPHDAKRINLSEDYEVRYWTEVLDISEEQLRQVVNPVRPMASDVRSALSTGN